MLGITFFLHFEDIKKYSQYSIKKQEIAKQHSIMIRLYTIVIILDYLVQVLFKVIIPQKLGKTIICDRYLFDTIINDIPRRDNTLDSMINKMDFYFHFIPKPDFVFLIDIPEEIAFNRKNDTPSIDYLIEKRGIYLDLGRKYGFKFLDGCKTQDELIKNVTDDVFHEFNNNIT
jgi:dTMP kinase